MKLSITTAARAVGAAAAAATIAAATFTVAGGTAAWANGAGRVLAQPCLNFHNAPGGSATQIGCIPYNTTISIDCTATANPVTGPYGTEATWDHTTWNGMGGFVSDAWIYTGTNGAVAGPCAATPTPAPAPPPQSSGRAMGRTTDHNLGYPGYCTWGALEQWHAATGYYPYWTGDARFWATTARTNGWTVVPDAQPRSIVVFQPGTYGVGSAGHVGWVTSVSQRSDGRYITMIEMNGFRSGSPPGRFNQYDTITLKDTYGMSYILAP